jgi:hypothetical protein
MNRRLCAFCDRGLIEDPDPTVLYCRPQCERAAWLRDNPPSHRESTFNLPAIPACAYCGGALPVERRRGRGRKFCNDDCRAAALDPPRLVNLAPGEVGAVAELLVSADLLARGYEVFRAVSQNCSCDLVIHRAGRLWRVEVKTGQNRPGAAVYAPRGNPNHYNLLAVVIWPGAIIYTPALDVLDMEAA